ncbi:hypothetical protein quinque_016324 [Culex quinquefasciatus]
MLKSGPKNRLPMMYELDGVAVEDSGALLSEETEGEVGGKLVYMLAEPERKRSRAADGDGQAMPCSDALPGMTDHQGHASPRKLPHRLPTAYAPAPAPEDMVKFNLERCNLALLHQQNTGRLFIVLFEKKKKLLSEVFRCRFLTWA